jgi:hypothetical protein
MNIPGFRQETFSALADQIAAAACELGCELEVPHYLKLEAAGVLRVFAARSYADRPEGEMIGFILFTVANHPHKLGQRWAFGDLSWIRSDWRDWARDQSVGPPAGIEAMLLMQAEIHLGVDGVVAIRATARADEEDAFLGLKYRRVEMVFDKSLDMAVFSNLVGRA